VFFVSQFLCWQTVAVKTERIQQDVLFGRLVSARFFIPLGRIVKRRVRAMKSMWQYEKTCPM
jgi:hypothetical protein